MKTITEFSGFVLADALKKLVEISPKPVITKGPKKDLPKKTGIVIKPKAQAVEAAPAVETPESAAAASSSSETDATPSDITPTDITPTDIGMGEPVTEGAEVSVAPAETAADATPATEATPTAEPAAPVVDTAALMGEAFKMEGEKLGFFMNALEIAKRRPQHIKRIIVMSLNEGEKAPADTIEKDGKVYLMEHFFVPEAQKHLKKGKTFGKGGGKGGGKGKKFGDKKRSGGGGPGRGDSSDRPRGPRAPRDGAGPGRDGAQANSGKKPVITPKANAITPKNPPASS